MSGSRNGTTASAASRKASKSVRSAIAFAVGLPAPCPAEVSILIEDRSRRSDLLGRLEGGGELERVTGDNAIVVIPGHYQRGRVGPALLQVVEG